MIAFRPQSPAAYEAHIAMAHYYAGIEAPRHGRVPGGVGPAGYRCGAPGAGALPGGPEDDQDAYSEYLRLLNKQPDAFEVCAARAMIRWTWPGI